jgi:ankyrin repeat protein
MTLLGGLLGVALHVGLSLILVALYVLPFGFNERLYHLTAFGWILPAAPGAAVLGALLGYLQPPAPTALTFVRAVVFAGLNAFLIAPPVMLLAVGRHPAPHILLINYFVMGILSVYLIALPIGWGFALPLTLHGAGRPHVRRRAMAGAVTACAVLALPFAVWPVRKQGQFAVPKVNEAIIKRRPAEALAAIQAGEPVDVMDRLGSYAIIEASEKGEVEIVRALLARGASVAVTDGHGFTAIFVAAQWGHVDVLRALLEAGADVNDGAAKGRTPLSAAVRSGNVAAVRLLLKSGARLDVKGASGPELMRRASDLGRDDVAAVLAEHGVAGPPEAEKQGRRALQALRDGGTEEALALVRQGADPNASDSSGSLLVDAIRLHERPLVEALLAAGVDPNRHRPGDDSALAWAVREEPELVPGLLARGARPDDRPSDSHRTALLEAAEFGDLAVVEALVRAGADLTVAVEQRTALERAADAGNADVVAFLRQAGAPPGAFRVREWKEKDARLTEAVREGKKQDARFWLRHGADPDDPRFTPLVEAVDGGHTAVVKLLLAAGADPLRRDRAGRTSLDAAAGKEEILALLQKAARARTRR